MSENEQILKILRDVGMAFENVRKRHREETEQN